MFSILELRNHVGRLGVLLFTALSLIAVVMPEANLLGGNAYAQTPSPTPSPTPWQADPMGNPSNYTIFRNDNFFLAGQSASRQDEYGYSTPTYYDQKFTAKAGSTYAGMSGVTANIPHPTNGRYANTRIVSAAGHIFRPDAEQGVIFKLLDWQGDPWNTTNLFGSATYHLQIFDANGTLYEHTFAPVQAGLTSHLDVAVGDLDRRRNANGDYQDEVVLVSTSESASGTGGVMQVTVLSFLKGAQSPQITTISSYLATNVWMPYNDFGVSPAQD
ncbi:MAG: hypothetical protein M3430_11240, partial [Acidobacteriota bacterium]|nr:hypothetical protein [Acidobacteriota bacterium]